jgi:predicted enzyme related to lactoylglutathione lyase
MKITSAYICVQNMDRAITFYQKLFDQPVMKRDEITSCFDVQGFRLFLFDHQKANETVTYGDNCLLSIEVDDITAAQEKLAELDTQIVFPLTRIGDKLVLEFKDPEGNDMEIYADA